MCSYKDEVKRLFVEKEDIKKWINKNLKMFFYDYCWFFLNEDIFFFFLNWINIIYKWIMEFL